VRGVDLLGARRLLSRLLAFALKDVILATLLTFNGCDGLTMPLVLGGAAVWSFQAVTSCQVLLRKEVGYSY
jgi:hypothetical protein